MDPELYNKCEQEYDQQCLNRQHEVDERQHRWELIQHAAMSNANTNHIDQREVEMQIDMVVNVPERILEEPERHSDDIKMSVDAEGGPPAA